MYHSMVHFYKHAMQSGYCPPQERSALLAVQLSLKVLDPLIGQSRQAYGDDHRVDGAADGADGLELALLITKAQPRLLRR